MGPAALLMALVLVQEGPAPRRVDVVFRGNANLSNRNLRQAVPDEIQDLETRGGRNADADDTAFALETYYREQGYPDATVAWELIPHGDTVEARFTFTEGPRCVVRERDVEGNATIPDEVLEPLLQGPREGFLGSGDLLFVQSEAESWADRVRDLYRERGFLDVKVQPPRVQFSPDHTTASIGIRVDEGNQYRVKALEVSGNEHLAGDELQELRQEFLNAPYYPRKIFELRARVFQFYEEAGFAAARVAVEEMSRDPEGNVALAVRVQEGQMIRIRDIRVEGNDSTRTGFIESRLTLEPGDVFRLSERQDSFAELYGSGLFERVELDLEGEGDERTLVVKVSERPSIETFVRGGYGSYEKLRGGAGIRENNLFGSGRSLDLDAGASQVGYRSTLTFSDPWLLDSKFRLDVPVSLQRRREPSFTRREASAGLAVRRSWTSSFSSGVGYTVRRSEAIALDAALVGTEADNVRIGNVFLEAAHDTRDFPFDPSSGHRVSTRVEYGDQVLGSELEFFQVEAGLSQFVELHEDLVLGVGARSSWIIPVGSTTDIPIQERFFNGGESSVRSFQESELGPMLNGSPSGGQVANTGNVELRWDAWRAFQLAAFFDAGNVAETTSRAFRDFRYGVGGGVRYLLPIGALRLDVGVNPNPRDDEEHVVVHFSVGMAF